MTEAIDIGRFVLLRPVGGGGFGEVAEGVEKDSQRRVALKLVDKSNPLALELGRREIRLLQKLQHANLTPLIEWFETSEVLVLVLEFMPGGDLQQMLENRGALSESTARRAFYQTCLAVEYLHSSSVAHRDIKPSNIVLDSLGAAHLTDLGCATESAVCRDTAGSDGYMAPEVCHHPRDGYDPQRADIWSLGCLLFAMLTAMLPCQDGSSSIAWRPMQSTARDLIDSMLVENPSARPTIAEVLQHPWLATRLSSSALFSPLLSNGSSLSRSPSLGVEENAPDGSPRISRRASGVRRYADEGLGAPSTASMLRALTPQVAVPAPPSRGSAVSGSSSVSSLDGIAANNNDGHSGRSSFHAPLQHVNVLSSARTLSRASSNSSLAAAASLGVPPPPPPPLLSTTATHGSSPFLVDSASSSASTSVLLASLMHRPLSLPTIAAPARASAPATPRRRLFALPPATTELPQAAPNGFAAALLLDGDDAAAAEAALRDANTIAIPHLFIAPATPIASSSDGGGGFASALFAASPPAPMTAPLSPLAKARSVPLSVTPAAPAAAASSESPAPHSAPTEPAELSEASEPAASRAVEPAEPPARARCCALL